MTTKDEDIAWSEARLYKANMCLFGDRIHKQYDRNVVHRTAFKEVQNDDGAIDRAAAKGRNVGLP